MRKLIPFLLLVFLVACQSEDTITTDADITSEDSPIETPAPATDLLKGIDATDRTYVPGRRIGRITTTSTLEELAEQYGAENVRKDSISLGKGVFVEGYKLFPGTSAELSLMYPNTVTRSRDLQITIDLESTDWKSAQNGVAIGSTLEELERYNGHPFTFFGFDWDYGGVVTDWQGGALKDHRLRLGYDYDNRDKGALHKTVRGEQKVVSGNPYLDDLGVKVIQIIVRLPKPE